ncbi:MAG: bifunctional RNase H/acid phosphatase [Rhodoluna sp.]|nr:bifunctional RNase H/acid phosphatase [Rhodoluna sp.]
MSHERLIIEADGGSRGNPGPSGSGAILIDADTGVVVTEISTFGGVASNNVAEYKAVIAGLTEAFRLNPKASITVRMDSKLVVEQMSGNWKIKHPDMQVLGIAVQKLVAGKNVSWAWIPREQNSRADALANEAMDTERDSVRHLEALETEPSSSKEFSPTSPSSVRAPGDVTEPLTTLILVRHGRTPLTEANKISGGDGDDPGLSALGLEDANAVADLLAGLGSKSALAQISKPTAVVSSPMKRAMETANVIASKLGLSVANEENLKEISFGDWDGHTNQQVGEGWPEIFEAWRGSWEVTPPNGESLETFDKKIRTARDAILKKYSGQTVVVVAHVMPIRGFLSLALDAGASGYWVAQVAPGSVTIIRQWGNTHSELVTANFTAHL